MGSCLIGFVVRGIIMRGECDGVSCLCLSGGGRRGFGGEGGCA